MAYMSKLSFDCCLLEHECCNSIHCECSCHDVWDTRVESEGIKAVQNLIKHGKPLQSLGRPYKPNPINTVGGNYTVNWRWP